MSEGDKCGDAEKPESMKSVAVKATSEPLQIIYTCKEGLKMHGNDTRYCIYGRWTGAEPECQKICSMPSTIPNGEVFVDKDPAYGNMANYSCKHRRLLEGNSTIMCTRHGQWDSAPPRCVLYFSKHRREDDESLILPIGLATIAVVSIFVCLFCVVLFRRKLKAKTQNLINTSADETKRSSVKCELQSLDMKTNSVYSNEGYYAEVNDRVPSSDQKVYRDKVIPGGNQRNNECTNSAYYHVYETPSYEMLNVNADIIEKETGEVSKVISPVPSEEKYAEVDKSKKSRKSSAEIKEPHRDAPPIPARSTGDSENVVQTEGDTRQGKATSCALLPLQIQGEDNAVKQDMVIVELNSSEGESQTPVGDSENQNMIPPNVPRAGGSTEDCDANCIVDDRTSCETNQTPEAVEVSEDTCSRMPYSNPGYCDESISTED